MKVKWRWATQNLLVCCGCERQIARIDVSCVREYFCTHSFSLELSVETLERQRSGNTEESLDRMRSHVNGNERYIVPDPAGWLQCVLWNDRLSLKLICLLEYSSLH